MTGPKRCLAPLILVFVVLCADRAQAVNILVTSDADSGSNTLRNAIETINSLPADDEHAITFGPTVEIIVLLSALPPIDRNVTIDGEGRVTLLGAELVTGDGLLLQGPGNFIRGLTIVGFPGNGIRIDGTTSDGAPGNAIVNCRIGTTGSIAVGNGESGVFLNQVTSAFIGRAGEGDLNIISGNVGAGVWVRDSDNVRIRNNYIGTNEDGTEALANDFGILVESEFGTSANVYIGEPGSMGGNVISGNVMGVLVSQAEDVEIDNNYIGPDAAGSGALGNGNGGVVIVGGERVAVGVEAGNLISGGNGTGVSIVTGDSHRLQRNIVGLDHTGTVSLGNSFGISVTGGTNHLIGGPNQGDGNVISGNLAMGINISLINTDGPANLTVQGNRIGVQAALDVPPANQFQTGIYVEKGMSVLIGGEEGLAGNLIAHNNVGIYLDEEAQAFTMRRNSIFSNAGGGIVLAEGANGGVEPPELISLEPASGQTAANGVVDFYADEEDQGRLHLGTVVANGEGTFSFPALDPMIYAGMNLTMTLTTAGNNTSAFSAPAAIGTPVPTTHAADTDGNLVISLSELLRVIQFFNSGGLHCANPPDSTEDGFVPGANPDQTACTPHSSDYNPQDWSISLGELLRLIQFFNSGGYHPCPDVPSSEDGFCPGAAT